MAVSNLNQIYVVLYAAYIFVCLFVCLSAKTYRVRRTGTPASIYNEHEGLHVEEVTVYRNLHGRGEAESCKFNKGRGEAEFFISGIRIPLRYVTRLHPEFPSPSFTF